VCYPGCEVETDQEAGMGKLTERELVFAEVSMEHNRSIRYIAKELGIDESTLRYRIERRQQGKKDGRKGKTEACEPFNDVIQSWCPTSINFIMISRVFPI